MITDPARGRSHGMLTRSQINTIQAAASAAATAATSAAVKIGVGAAGIGAAAYGGSQFYQAFAPSIYGSGKRSSSAPAAYGRNKSGRNPAVVTSARQGLTYLSVSKKKGKKRKTSSITKLKKAVKKINRNMPKQASRIVKTESVHQLESVINQAAYKFDNHWNRTTKEGYCADLKFFDRAAVPAAKNIDIVTPTGVERVLTFKNIYLYMKGRNNNTLPANVSIYWFKVVDDTDFTPLSLMQSLDNNFNIVDADLKPLCTPSDFPDMGRYFKLIKVDKFTLQPGDEFKSYHTKKIDNHKVELNRTQVSGNHRKGDIVTLCRIMGTVCHGISNNNQVGYAPATLDWINGRRFRIVYPSDANFRDMKIDTTYSAVGGGAEVSGPNVELEVDTL